MRAPKPSRRAVISTRRSMPRQSPQPNGTPISSLPSQPRSTASATNASVTPSEIVSIPSRSQRSFARISASGFEIPSIGPKAKIVSYSGILARVPANSPSAIAYCLPHATGHLRHVVSRSW
ncbi:MAG: hypothetical protein DME07_10585 [Candidatus Rokuibacteriota bacterium]|nr:MAG: hypothetical protein DME07_10585 [Candidatus Rokubacteria bacterium]PYN57165.1 MAG: hypothetical protein DMD94_05170 [Candidatus Rokubacteria bacterium]